MGKEELKSYEIDIEEPEQIHIVVEETIRRARNGEEIEVILNHEEPPNRVRGNSEAFLYDSSPHETRRADGGDTFYHMPYVTRCYMNSEELNASREKSHRSILNEWTDYLKGRASMELKAKDGDLHVETGEQLIGGSARIEGGVALRRACWYDGDPAVEQRGVENTVLDLLEEDAEAIREEERFGEPEFSRGEFRQSYEWSKELTDEFKDERFQQLEVDEFTTSVARKRASIYMNKDRKYGNKPNTCVSMMPAD